MDIQILQNDKRLSQELLDTVTDIYCDDEFSRQLPGKKDYVSVSKNVYVSKQLLLCNVKEIFIAYKSKCPDNKIGFSKFTSLRPKWCISVGPKGTHSVCVCTIHQNLYLMLNAIELEKSDHSLIEMIVCHRSSKLCVVHHCDNCPCTVGVRDFLHNHFFGDREIDEDDESGEEIEIEFQQWTTVERTELVSMKLSATEFIDLLIQKLDKITVHSFIAQAQSVYLNNLKETIGPDEAIVLVTLPKIIHYPG